jgi:predicted AlkP superfamily phosphohydrolase/phosphomutase
LASSHTIKEPKIWDLFEEKVCLVGVPPSYPPKPVNGCMISCFITPSTEKEYTYPKDLKEEIERLTDGYLIDVDFRTDKKERLLKEIYTMTKKRFKVIKHLIGKFDWRFFMFVEIGLDRIHHAFWKYYDEEHHLYKPQNRFKDAIKNYYLYLDKEIGDLLSIIGDDTLVFVVSDHGAKRMKGAFCVNEWLIQKGYLKLKKKRNKITYLEDAEIDWNRSMAWGWGGYYSRIFLNVEGREEQGVVKQKEYEKTRNILAKELRNIRGPNGESWKTKVLKPEELYQECNGNPPDLMVYFDDLYWRSAGTIGHNTLYLPENDIGPDDAVHAHEGIFLFYDPKKKYGKEVNIDILDVAPTILHYMGLPIPNEMEGTIIVKDS